jgi:hypothetical protein
MAHYLQILEVQVTETVLVEVCLVLVVPQKEEGVLPKRM